MKKYLFLFMLILAPFILPIYGQTTEAKAPTTISVNRLTYMPTHDLHMIEDRLYISGEDLAALTYGEYTKEDTQYCLKIQNKVISYSPETDAILLDGIHKKLSCPTHELSGVLYLPIDVLDLLSYPYILSDDKSTLQITPKLPYSTAQDDPSSHHLFKTKYSSFKEVLTPLIEEANVDGFIQKAKQEKSYITFMSAANKARCFEEINALLSSQTISNLENHVYIRQLDCSTATPTLSSFLHLNLKYKLTSDSLNLELGQTASQSKIFWSTYSPYQEDSIYLYLDLNKSLDSMIMRSIYDYYRKLYDFKDDIETSPIAFIQSGICDQMHYRVYFNEDKSNEYQVVIYKMTTGKANNYYVDLIKASK